MARYIGKQRTVRYQLPYDKVPMQGNYIRGVDNNRWQDYGAILDSVYEMADMVARSNGCSIKTAVATVLNDEEYYILPSHKTMIIAKLTEES